MVAREEGYKDDIVLKESRPCALFQTVQEVRAIQWIMI